MKDQQFYATAAQVIPVFVLALAFEYRYFDARNGQTVGPLFLLSMLIALAGGEATAFIALLTEEGRGLTSLMVMVALTYGGIGLFVPLFLPSMQQLSESLPPDLVSAVKILWPAGFVVVFGGAALFNSGVPIAAAVVLLFLVMAVAAFVSSTRREWATLRGRRAHRAEAGLGSGDTDLDE